MPHALCAVVVVVDGGMLLREVRGRGSFDNALNPQWCLRHISDSTTS